MQVFLYHHIAATRIVRILITNDCRLWQSQTHRVRGTIDKLQQVAPVEITESRNFIDNSDRIAKGLQQDFLELND
ncbi:hypothetical protein D3C86_2213510 [compost metagenome]